MGELHSNFDWSLAQSFVAVAETGSLSAAARMLGQSQPTIGRHIKELERQLGAELFQRLSRGFALTPHAHSLLPHAKAMATAAARLSLGAAGESQDIAGTVRITASVIVSHFVLPRIIAKIRQQLPMIKIELVASDTTENLLFRDADIAIRMYRPEQLDLVAKHIGDQPLALYGATSYLDRVGRPDSADDLMKLDFIGFDKSDLAIRSMKQMGIEVTPDFFVVRTDDQAAYWQMVQAGCGLGGAQVQIGDATPGVERIELGLDFPALPTWLTAPQVIRTSPRIRAVWDVLVEELGARPSSID